MDNSKIHVTINHSRGTKKPHYIFGIVTASLLITATLISNVVMPYTVNAANININSEYVETVDSETINSLLSTSLEETKQLYSLLKSGTVDYSYLESVYDALTDVNRRICYNEEYDIDAFTSDVVGLSNYINSIGNYVAGNETYKLLVNTVDCLTDMIKFEDVSSDAWFYNDVYTAISLGLINGKGNNCFAPQDNLTVAEAMKLVATVNASYYNRVDKLSISQKGHWALNYYAYVMNNSIAPANSFTQADLDTQITRGQMALLFANVLPVSEYSDINDFSTANESLSDENIIKLYKAGILIGDSSGFRVNDTITRAETAAIINRLSLKENRIKVTQPIEKKPVASTLLYVTDPAHPAEGAQRISYHYFEGSQPINVLYNHTYNCANQQEYDAVISAVTEAYNSVMADYEPSGNVLRFINNELTDEEMSKPSVSSVLMAYPNDKEKQIEAIKAFQIHAKINTFLKTNYIYVVQDDGQKDVIDAYSALYTSKDKTCEAWAAIDMAIYDVMGYNSLAYGSDAMNHMAVGIEINGVYFTPIYGGTVCTLEEAKEIIPDIVIDLYETNSPKPYSTGRVRFLG